MFTVPGSYLAKLLDWINAEWFGSYALTIIVFTVALKLLTLPMDIYQRKEMRKMQEHQPELTKIQKRYQSNPQVAQKKMSEYRKKHAISQFSGCLPMIVSLFVFGIFLNGMNTWGDYKNIELYLTTSKMETVEQKEEYFMGYKFGWIANIWMPDSGTSPVIAKYETFSNPKRDWKRLNKLMTTQEMESLQQVTEEQYNTKMQFARDMYPGRTNGWFLFPILAGITMLLMQMITTRLNPMPQQGGKMMMIVMTGMWFFFCLSSNTAFALYAMISNVAALAVTMIVNKDNLSNLLPKKKKEKVS